MIEPERVEKHLADFDCVAVCVLQQPLPELDAATVRAILEKVRADPHNAELGLPRTLRMVPGSTSSAPEASTELFG